MQVFPLKTKTIKPGDDIVDAILGALHEAKLVVKDGDVLVVSSKIISVAQNRLVELNTVRPSKRAQELARKFHLDPKIAEVVLNEADNILGGASGLLLTIKNGLTMPNAGVDVSNAPLGCVVLLPKDPMKEARKIRERMRAITDKRIGVIVIDSRVFPLRVGTTGVCIGAAGFEPLKDFREKKDLFGKKLKITLQALADDLGSAAHTLMGEADERIPAVLIRGAPITLTSRRILREELSIHPIHCLYLGALRR